MKKSFKILVLLLCLFALFGCQEGLDEELEDDVNSAVQLGDNIKMRDIYKLAVERGYEGSYSEWIEELQGDQIELRTFGDYIQWTYAGSDDWMDLVPLSNLMGANGMDGLSPHIGKNGNWWIGDEDTGVKAQGQGSKGDKGEDGKDGQNGLTPHVGQNGNWWIGDSDTGIRAEGQGRPGEDGKDGVTPHIGTNGNWWIGKTDTGVKAEGQAKPGEDGLTPHIGPNGNWWLGDTDTGVKAEAVGETGKSAYEIFKEAYPQYKGDEAQWLDDLLNGRLSEENYRYHTVTFDDGCGNITTVDVLRKTPVEMPEDPIKSGHIFIGWYTKKGVKWNFDANVVIKDMTLEAMWVKSNIQPTVYLSYTFAAKDAVYFDVYVDNVCTVEAISLYKGGELIEVADNADVREFNNLLSNTTYRVEVTYSYDLNDGFGKQFRVASSEITTLSKETPTITVLNTTTTYNSISLEVSLEDNDEVCEITSVELYKDDVLVESKNDLSNLVFENLLSNAYYKGKINYTFDYNDGNRPSEYCVEFSATTDALVEPVVTLNNLSTTQSEISADVIISDPSQISKLVSIELLEGEEVLHSATDMNLHYTGLTHNTQYHIVVTIEYDMNDGLGLVRVEKKFEVNTHPVYILLDTKILNTSAVVEGELVYIHAIVDNPSNAVFQKITINGKEYDVDPASTAKNVFAYVSMVEVGDTEFTIEKLVAVLDGIEFTYYTEENNTTIATVYEGLDIESIELVNEDLEKVFHFLVSEEKYLKINLNNPLGHSLDEVKFDGEIYKLDEDLIKLTDNEYLLSLKTSKYTWTRDVESSYITSYTYSNEDLNKTVNCNINLLPWAIIYDGNVYQISSAEDLLNVNEIIINDYDDYYFELTCDIDLEGIEWQGIDYFEGVFNGNGYSIKNMRFVKEIADSNVDYGLFKRARAVICDLTLDEMIIMLDLKNTRNKDYASYIGGFVGSINGDTLLYNCHVLNNSSISVNNGYSFDTSNVGGLAGQCKFVYNSSNGANINAKNSRVGALVGIAYWDDAMIENSYNTGNIYCHTNDNILVNNYGRIFNSYNTGSVNGIYGNEFNTNNAFTSISLGDKYANKTLNWNNKNYSFESNGGSLVETINTIMLEELPVPTKDGYYFMGWYENEDLSGKSYFYNYYSDNDVTLYAKWGKLVDFSDPIIVNDQNNPYVFVDGALQSTTHLRENLNEYVSADYRVNADRNILIIFTSHYDTGNISSTGDKTSIGIPNSDLYIHTFELQPGDYWYVHIYDYPGNTGITTLYDFIIVEGE